MDQQQQQALGCIVQFVVVAIVVVVMALVGGNFRTELTYTFIPEKTSATIGQFEETLNSRHWLFGLIKGEQPDLQKAPIKFLREGEQVSEITITTKHTWKDVLISVVTVGVYCPMTVVVQGKISKLQ